MNSDFVVASTFFIALPLEALAKVPSAEGWRAEMKYAAIAKPTTTTIIATTAPRPILPLRVLMLPCLLDMLNHLPYLGLNKVRKYKYSFFYWYNVHFR